MEESPNSRAVEASDSPDLTGAAPIEMKRPAGAAKGKDRISEKEARHVEARDAAARAIVEAQSGSWRERLARGFRLPRRLKFTREGKFFVGITLGVGFAAINTGNNLLYLLLGLLLALIVVSSIMSELSLRDLTVVRRLPMRAQVGRPHVVEIEVFNHKQRVPSYAIEVEDLRAGLPADKRCFFLKVSPRSAQVAAYRRTPSKRGRDAHTGFRIATRFPFGLFEKSREIPATGELIIYPATDPVAVAPHHGGHLLGGESMSGRGHGEEFLGLRPMREGEDPRDIYWKKSAAGQEVLRERARDARPQIVMLLDLVAPDSVLAFLEAELATKTTKGRAKERAALESKEAQEWLLRFEKRIRDVASRAVAHVKQGAQVTLRTSHGEAIVSTRQSGIDKLLRFLALVTPKAKPGNDTANARANNEAAE